MILVLANIGLDRRESGKSGTLAVAMAYGLLVILYGLGVMIGMVLQLVSVVAFFRPDFMADIIYGSGETYLDSLALLAVGLWLPSLLGIVLLIGPVRSLIAKIVPIDPDSPVDAVALSFTMIVFINLMVTLGVGLENLADLMETQGPGDNAVTTIVGLWAQQSMMAITAAVGIGWLTRRNWRLSFLRLGLERPTRRQALLGFGTGVVLVPIIILAEYGASELLGIQVDQDVDRLTEELLGAMFESPWGIATLGLAAALGEEPLFRGAAQPKFGILLTAILFALLHSNYGITLATGIVFVLGIVLGLLRLRYNTSTAMITHAVYNISLGLLAYWSISFLEP